MITRVSSPDTCGVTKNQRKNTKSLGFDKRPRISWYALRKYKPESSKAIREYEKQQNRALLTSVAVVIGAVIITIGGLLFSAVKH